MRLHATEHLNVNSDGTTQPPIAQGGALQPGAAPNTPTTPPPAAPSSDLIATIRQYASTLPPWALPVGGIVALFMLMGKKR